MALDRGYLGHSFHTSNLPISARFGNSCSTAALRSAGTGPENWGGIVNHEVDVVVPDHFPGSAWFDPDFVKVEQGRRGIAKPVEEIDFGAVRSRVDVFSAGMLLEDGA